MEVNLKISDERIRLMIIQDLVTSYRDLERDATQPKPGLPLHRLEDRSDARKYRKALLKVIGYYSTPSELEALNL